MNAGKKDFFGKTVADAIQQACDSLQASQENLTIEVIETGSSGIFGFIRKKAHIRVCLQEGADIAKPAPRGDQAPTPAPKKSDAEGVEHGGGSSPSVSPAPSPVPVDSRQQSTVVGDEDADREQADDEGEEELAAASVSDEPLSQESLDGVQQELLRLLELTGLPSRVEIEAQGSSVRCHVIGDFQEELAGQEGKVLDNLQYLLRKIIAKKISEKIRVAIDVGDYREKREDTLQELARELAAQVKADGKTQAIPSLNPSERRVVHMTLQDDKEIRSRSVGDGLFKKVLIYKPGKPKDASAATGTGGNGGKRPPSRGRRGKGGKPPVEGDGE